MIDELALVPKSVYAVGMTQTENIREIIAGEVRANLARNQKSQAWLDQKADISTSGLGRKMKGEVSFTAEELLRVEKAFGLSSGSLFMVATQAA